MIGTNNSNWVRDETASMWHNKAIKLADKRKTYETGKKVTKTTHPTSPRCFILNYE